MKINLAVKSLLLLGLWAVLQAQGDREEAFIGNRGRQWVFQKVVRSKVSPVHNAWILNEVDAFIWQGLRDEHLEPSSLP